MPLGSVSTWERIGKARDHTKVLLEEVVIIFLASLGQCKALDFGKLREPEKVGVLRS